MKYKLILGLIILSLFSSFVFASVDSAPPAIPMEIWGEVTVNGAPAADGLAVTAEVDSVDYAQASVTDGGIQSVILAGGDRPLTYEDDPDCGYHWNTLDEACVPCDLGIPGDCVEGPQDGEIVVLKVDGHIVKPYGEWKNGSVEEVNVSGITEITITLTVGWNLFSLPLIPIDHSLSNVLSSCSGKYDVVWTTTSGDVWKSSNQFFNPLNTIEYDKSYLIYMNDNCDLTVSGYAQYKTNVQVTPGWNLIGYYSIETVPLGDVLAAIDYSVVWTTTSGDVWKSSNQFFNPLTYFTGGGGYESYIDTGGDYDVTY